MYIQDSQRMNPRGSLTTGFTQNIGLEVHRFVGGNEGNVRVDHESEERMGLGNEMNVLR